MTTMALEEPAELRSVLERAQEIESETGLLLRQNPDWADMIHAAQEAGVPREAILEALRERVSVAQTEYEPNDLVFATTGSGWYNAARIESVKNGRARVRFLGGGDADVDYSDIKRFNLAPGDKVHFHYYGSWVQADVMNYNRDSQGVTVSYWGTNETKTLESIRLRDPKFVKPVKDQMLIWAYSAASFLAGAGLTAIIMRIASR